MSDTDMFIKKSFLNFNSWLLGVLGAIILWEGQRLFNESQQTHDQLLELRMTAIPRKEFDAQIGEIHIRLDRIEQELKLKPNK